MPDCSGEPVVTTSCASYILHARLRVQRAPGIPCALSIRAVDAKLGRIAPRERGDVCLDWLFEISRRPGRGSSWPGLSRPSTCFCAASKDVDARHKAGHDEWCFAPTSRPSTSFVAGPRTWMPGTRPGMTSGEVGTSITELPPVLYVPSMRPSWPAEPMNFASHGRSSRRPSWPGLSRPSTCFGAASKDVDARHKAGHDEW